MARSHHRKKHKQHVQQFRHAFDDQNIVSKSKAPAKWVIGILGAVLGFAIGYFASAGNIVWMLAAMAAGGLGGYFIGRKIDTEKSKT